MARNKVNVPKNLVHQMKNEKVLKIDKKKEIKK